MTPDGIHPSICRFCHAHCGILVEISGGRPTRVTGDRENPLFRGFSCAKGRQLGLQHEHPERVLRSLARAADGALAPIATQRAIDEIAEKLRAIVAEHGPRSVAIYLGTYTGPHPASAPFAVAWLLALGSRMIFTSASIDQPGKNVANALHGRWLGGAYLFPEADVWLFVGTNPPISMSGGISVDPGRSVRRAVELGAKLIAIDPRRSELARSAEIFLQPRPGEDAALLAAMLHVILREGLGDADFTATEASGLEALAKAVAPFDPAYAARRCDVPAAEIERAARLFAGAARAGATAGTGPNMSGHGNLVETLLLCLMTVCGHWRRAGEALPNAGAFLTPAHAVAQAEAPRRAFGYGPKLRVRGLGNNASGLPTAALADEILLEGEGRVRALVCIGSNPVAAWPDQLKAIEAMQALELLVCLDTRIGATSRHADYLIAPKIAFEVPGYSLFLETLEQTYAAMGIAAPYAQYAPALVEPPAGSDLIEEWRFFYQLAQRMGLPLRLTPVRSEAGPRREDRAPIEVDMQREPSGDEVLEWLARGSRVPLDEVKRHPHGAIFDAEPALVASKQPGSAARLELANPEMLAELAALRREPLPDLAQSAHPFRLISRRLPNVYNSSGRDLPAHLNKRAHNPAFLHPEDLAVLGLRDGDLIEIRSERAAILGIAESAPELRRGVVSMAHAFGDAPERDAEVRRIGSCTGRLVSADRDFDPYTGIPRMSAIPVAVSRYSVTPSID